MPEITKTDYMNLFNLCNDMVTEQAMLVIQAAMVEVKFVDSAVLLAACQRNSDKLKELTLHIVGE